MRPRHPFHPFLFALYPVLSLLAFNINQLGFAEAGRSFLVILAGTAVLLVIAQIWLQDWDKAALLTSLFVILFFSYGHAARFLQDRVSSLAARPSAYDLNRYLSALWAVIFILGTWAIWRVLKRDLRAYTRFLNTAAAVALFMPTLSLATHAIRSLGTTPHPGPTLAATQTQKHTQPTASPDIYYIVMDAYGRQDVLRDVYNFDNSAFLSFLEERGFYVAVDSHSNFGQTSLSLASSLNFKYLGHLAASVGESSSDRQPLAQMIQESQLRTFLESHGYQIISVASGWRASELRDADTYLAASGSVINDFEGMLLGNTVPGTLFQTTLLFEMKRRRVRFAFDALGDTVNADSPKFVFAHVVSPHPPFVFGPNGEAVDPDRDYTLFDGVEFGLSRESYIRGYRDQVRYMNILLEQTIDYILAESASPPVIILQGDHGPGAYVNWGSVERTCLPEKMSILNAYYLPGTGASHLYKTITPVNSFRVVLDNYFNAGLGLLEDKSYFSLWDTPYDFVEVTTQLESDCRTLAEE
ncbi:MAG: sulfatase-like hydrolase/transferase [Anaerolineae bacterium]